MGSGVNAVVFVMNGSLPAAKRRGYETNGGYPLDQWPKVSVHDPAFALQRTP